MSAAQIPPLAEAPGPLDGIVVADFSRILAGPYCTMLLADMGATVIKVEGPGGDDTRSWIPPQREGISTYYMSINRNKSSIKLDLGNEEDLSRAYQIIDRADVFVENFKPGGLEKFGLDAESVAIRWPHIIHASITGFGTSAGDSMPGYDLLAQAMSGMMSLTGAPDADPQRAGVAVFDVMTGLHTAVAVLGALQARNATGQGQHVALNLLSSAMSGLVNQTTGFVAAGNVPMRMGNDHPSLFPYGPLQAADRPLVICCGNDLQFNRLASILGQPHLARQPEFSSMSQRNVHREELRSLLEEALAKRSADEWFDEFQDAGVPCAPILTVGEGIDFAQRIGLEPVALTGRGDARVPTIRHPAVFSRSSIRYDKAPPALDEDRASVLQWLESSRPRAMA
ncbi:CaiB/BaiF CoA transferase family protein [Glutamicibacter sp. NPDC127525]|uniref:CaiB/BaiF CoA transferase family protein n=1 Tax=unclassified Glutamicibacter TaxID=2627139 RepID=UPI00362DD040